MRRLALLLLATTALAAPTDPSRSRGREEPDVREEAPRLVEQRLEPKPLAIVGADVHPVTAPTVPGGTLLLRDGRIEAILDAGEGARRRPKLESQGYEVIEAAGLHAWPGLVAAGADGLGLAYDAWAGGESQALRARLADSFDAWDEGVELAAASGITTALVYRAAGNPKGPFSGRTALLKMSAGEPRGALLREGAAVTGSARILSPEGRFALRQAIEKAREDDPKEDDAAAVLLHDLATRKVALLVATDGIADVTAALDLAAGLDLSLVLYLPSDAWALAERLARQDVDVVQHVRPSWGKPRASRRAEIPGGWRFDAPARLVAAGVDVAVLPINDSLSLWGVAGRDLGNLPMEAAYAQRGGLSPQQALESITIVPARMFGVSDRVGSLERGKDADVILTDGDLLDYRTWVRTTIVNGRVAYRAGDSRFWKWCIERRDAALASGSQQPPPPRPSPEPSHVAGSGSSPAGQ